ncbi:MAG: hypothetical protein Kow006_04400 [Gammaproteobacteria bacterium]
MSMYNADLAFDKAPPIDAPFRFFLTAPLFGMAAAVVLGWYGSEALGTRWAPPLLSATHLMTLGVLAMVMFGAVIQMVAVVAGSPAARPRLLGGAVHILLTLGVVSLGIAFLNHQALWMRVSVVLLSLGIATFVALALIALARAPRAHDTVLGMELAVTALAVTLGMGLTLAAGHGFDGVPLHRIPLTNIHLVWGIAGWVGLLVVGVAFQVVPMFQITPSYPDWMTRWLVRLLFAGLVLWSSSDLLLFWYEWHWDWPMRVGGGVLLAGYAAFAIVTLRLQARRRRRLPDVTTNFWRVGMVSLLLGGATWALAQFWEGFADHRLYGLLLGVLLIGGFAWSVVNGMLYKIVPFLAWFHLQNRMLNITRPRPVSIPNMKQIVPDAAARRQFRFHVVALLLLLAALFQPVAFVHAAALAFFVSFALLGWNILSASRIYHRHLRQITTPPADTPADTPAT